jgi:uncharacterized SAM-binding protein YcdF (DUF218 family)
MGASKLATGGRQKRRGIGKIAAALILALGLLAGGFLAFAASIPREETILDRSADGIVALTGGASRIDDAIELLAAKRGRLLLISGVHPHTMPAELVRPSAEIDRLFSCCIELDREAQNTVGNAVATAQWARKHNIRSLIVVTSAWHMPRALLELERELPGVALIPYPVVSEHMRDDSWWVSAQTIRLLLVEYIKYVAALAHLRTDAFAPAMSVVSQQDAH